MIICYINLTKSYIIHTFQSTYNMNKKNPYAHTIVFTTSIQAYGCLKSLYVSVLSKIKHYYIFPMLLEYNDFKYSIVGYLNIFNSRSI